MIQGVREKLQIENVTHLKMWQFIYLCHLFFLLTVVKGNIGIVVIFVSGGVHVLNECVQLSGLLLGEGGSKLCQVDIKKIS